jgi:3-methyladenine DNA glycosylase AlkD
MKMTALDASQKIRALANPGKAKILSGFFKTGPGQYGEGDKFLGVMVPQTRNIAQQFLELPLPELQKLIRSPWHEERLLGLIILVLRSKRCKTERERKTYFDFYIRQMRWINNWDLVDLTAVDVIGGYLWDKPTDILLKWVKSKRLWDRRVAVLATFYFIRKGRFDESLRLSEMLLKDEEDLMHKAVGWMLREMGKRDEKKLLAFLESHAAHMPRTMLRYSLEKLSEPQKRRYMAYRSRSTGSLS